ncbi:hypothetical protein OQA88_12019 [Cercophora sp. LCS_1]
MSNLPPPSYEEATTRADWLAIVAPYVWPQSYISLCLVSRRFHSQFAPRLWNDPVAIIRVLRRNVEDDLERYCDFILDHLSAVRPTTRDLVQCLDLRGFAHEAEDFSLDDDKRTIHDTLKALSAKLPKLRCILLDQHPQVVINALARNNMAPGLDPPRLLSLRGCQAKLEGSFLLSPYAKDMVSPYFSSLVYLDISGCPEVVASKRLLASLLETLRVESFSKLRVLKVGGLDMGDNAVGFLLDSFKDRPWSVDLSGNRLTDGALGSICGTFPHGTLRDRSGHRFDIEGGLKIAESLAPDFFGPAYFIDESDCSANFSHPDRHFTDAPTYHGVQDGVLGCRLDGRSLIKSDLADGVKKVLLNHPRPPHGTAHHLDDLELCQGGEGVTHLRLNDNAFTAAGIADLLRSAPGHLQLFECNAIGFSITVPSGFPKDLLPTRTKFTGILGAAHLYRPVFSSNLQALRIHHSLVTNLVTIETDYPTVQWPTLLKTWVAETLLLPKADLAYPQVFTPDTNPRLRSLTLTGIPRRSAGPLINKLIGFLKLASLQEASLHSAKASSTRHAPQTLHGLRHIGLEFEHDPQQEFYDLQASSFESSSDFSFFATSGWDSSSSARAPEDESQSARLAGPGMPDPTIDHEYLSRKLASIPSPVSIWIGPCNPVPKFSAVNAYARLARLPDLQRDVQPASPCHVAAGVPRGAYIFGAAWREIVAPDVETARMPRREELMGMRDVLEAIKEFRSKARTGHQVAVRKGRTGVGMPCFWWTGELRVEWADGSGYYTKSKFWR